MMYEEFGIFSSYNEITPSSFVIGLENSVQIFLEELRLYLNKEFTIYNEETDLEETFNVNKQIIDSVCDVIKNIHIILTRQNIFLKWPKINPLGKNELDIHWYDDTVDILLNIEDDYYYYSAKLKNVINERRKVRKGGDDPSEAIAGITSFCQDYYPKNVYPIGVSQPIDRQKLGTSNLISMTETPSSGVEYFPELDVDLLSSRKWFQVHSMKRYDWTAGSHYSYSLALEREMHAEQHNRWLI